MTDEMKPFDKSIEGLCKMSRASILEEAVEVKLIYSTTREGYETNSITEGIDYAEGMANLMLAYRHLEDARMRIGKCMQQLQGGVSIYDK